MLRLDKVVKPWKESAALNDHINLYGFWNETTFLTKSGDVGNHLFSQPAAIWPNFRGSNARPALCA
jgi:hypothetical protein